MTEPNWYRSMGAMHDWHDQHAGNQVNKEAQMAYATSAMVTDFDCWRLRKAHVTADSAITDLMEDAGYAQKIAV
jgi:5'-methylthioadenosine phosphorylase